MFRLKTPSNKFIGAVFAGLIAVALLIGAMSWLSISEADNIKTIIVQNQQQIITQQKQANTALQNTNKAVLQIEAYILAHPTTTGR